MVTAIRSLPTLEPIRDIIAGLVASDFQDSLDAVTSEAYGSSLPVVALPFPAAIQQEVLQNLSAQNVWPTLVIMTGGIRVAAVAEEMSGLRWAGLLDVYAALQNADQETLKRQLDRYALAIWHLLANNDPLGGVFQLLPASLQVAFSDPITTMPAVSVTTRAALVRVEVWW